MKDNMIKTKKQNAHLPLVTIGYILFSLLVIATLISTTIPFGMLLFNPNALHYNVAITLIALTLGALLPALLGYIIGDHSVKTKSKLSHHFTGVLFGLLAYWIMMLLTVFIATPLEFSESNRNINLLIVNLAPSIGVIVIATTLTITHIRSRQANQDIIIYKPFSSLLAASVVILPLWSLIQNIVTNSVSIYTFVPFIIVTVAGSISYLSFGKAKINTYDKVAWSAVSVSVLFVAMFVIPQLLSSISGYLLPRSTMETQTLLNWTGFALAFAAWATYWLKQVKALR